jgi:hypothetical protein
LSLGAAWCLLLDRLEAYASLNEAPAQELGALLRTERHQSIY